MVEFPDRFNMATYYLEDNITQGRGDRICLYYSDKIYTYSQVLEETNRVGNVLLKLGVEMEDRVLMILPDCPEFVSSWFAITKIGAVIAMVNPLLPTSDYEYYLDYTRAKVAIVDASALERIEPALSKARYLKHLLVVGPPAGHHQGYSHLVAKPSLELEPAPA